MRPRISSRALLVNVRHRIELGSKPFLISRPVRSVKVLVLPDPGPASVRIRPCTCEATCSCCPFSCMPIRAVRGREDTSCTRTRQCGLFDDVDRSCRHRPLLHPKHTSPTRLLVTALTWTSARGLRPSHGSHKTT